MNVDNVEVGDRMQNMLAFMTARRKNDEEAAMLMIGLKEEMEGEDYFKAVIQMVDMLLGVSDLALSMGKMLAMTVGVSENKFWEGIAMTMAWMNNGAS